jgi:hypothetical protein
MANPFAPAQQSSGMDAMLPLMMMSMSQSAPTPAAPAKAPSMSPGTFKPPGGGAGSFAGTPSVAPMQNQLGGKTLLGQ